jgi:ATP-dependent Lhr-like helicase
VSFKFLDIRIQEILADLDIKPTPGQSEYLKAIIANEDVLVVASTGSGKTFGTMIACLHRILEDTEVTPISVIVITPLKALNRDIFRRVLPQLAGKLGVSIAVRHGDTSSTERQKQTKNPPQILITTPELFQAILPAKILGREHLKNVKTVIIDEIHELIETKRGIQLTLAIERLSARTGSPIQRIGLSATLGSPYEVLDFLAPKSTNRRIVQIPSSKELNLGIDYPNQRVSDLNNLTKILHTTEEAARRFVRIIEIVKKETGTVLLFTNTRQQAEILGYRFNRYNEFVDQADRIAFEVHHSSLSTQTRLQAENEVREGNLEVIIATSSLELGIDIGAVSLVIQYMSPRRIETLIQRTGRAGHKLYQISKGIIIAETPRDLVESYLIKKQALAGLVEITNIHTSALDILFHGIIGILLDFGETSVRKILKIVTNAYPFKDFTSKDLLPLLEYGKENFFFFVNKDPETGVISLRLKRKSYRYYYSNLSSIPTKRRYSVIDVGTQNKVGTLDDGFVTTRGEKGAVFVLNGIPWEFLAQKEDKIEVKQVKGITEATIPTWSGELIPVSQMVTKAAIDLFESENANITGSPEVEHEIKKFVKEQKNLGLYPTKDTVIVESAGRRSVIHTFLGSKGNETLGIILSSIIGAKQGFSVEYRSDPYSIFFSLPRPVDLVDIIQSIETRHILPLLRHRISNSDLFSWRIRNVAKRFGAILEPIENSPKMTRFIVSRYKNTIIGKETINEIIDENMDLEAVIDFFQKIQSQELAIKEVQVKLFDSPLSMAATQPISMNVLKLRPSHIILEKIEKRLRNTWIRLVCMRLGCKFEKTRRIETLEEIIKCPECHSRFIAVVHPNNTKIKKLLNRSVSKNPQHKLDRKEKKDLNTAKKTADLVLSFGKRAAFVLAGRGIGPRTAVRILREPHKDTEDLLASIYSKEAEFARNREYWE